MKTAIKKQQNFRFSDYRAKKNTRPDGACLTDNRWERIKTLFPHYIFQTLEGAKNGVPLLDLARTQFGLQLPLGKIPPGVHVELTNHCNLACTYCTSPLKPRPQGMMSDETFYNMLHGFAESGIKRVYLVGLGESLLHPKFDEYAMALGRDVAYVSLTSNLQRVSDQNIETMMNAPIKLLNVSVDGITKEEYEKTRLRGKFEVLLTNLLRVKQAKQVAKSRFPKVNIRVMLKPSQLANKKAYMDFYRPYADIVSLQYVVNISDTDEDVFDLEVQEDRILRCNLTLKQIGVHWNGEVPLCTYAHHQAGPAEYPNFLIGNVTHDSISEIWNHPLLRKYQMAHKRNDKTGLSLCAGCGGC